MTDKDTSGTGQSRLGDDQADLLMAIVGIWMAIEELQKAQPPELQASRGTLALDIVTKALGKILARHDINITATVSPTEPAHE